MFREDDPKEDHQAYPCHDDDPLEGRKDDVTGKKEDALTSTSMGVTLGGVGSPGSSESLKKKNKKEKTSKKSPRSYHSSMSFSSPLPSIPALPSSRGKEEKEEIVEEKFPKVIELNVGGHIYASSIETLRRFPQSMLGLMFSGRHKTTKDKDGRYFIDRDGLAFGVILNFLRTDRVFFGSVDQDLVYSEAEYYRLPLVPEWQIGADLQAIKDNLDLEGEKTIVALLRKSTLSPWYSYAQETISVNIEKLVNVLSRGSQQHGSFGASLALYQNEKKKNTLSTSWKTEGPESGLFPFVRLVPLPLCLSSFPSFSSLSGCNPLDLVVAWFDLILYLEKVAQPLVEIWCHYLKRQGFTSITYRKKTHPVLHWSITLQWNTSPIEGEGLF